MPYFYDTRKMRKRLAGKKYSPALGTWVDGEKIIFGRITIPAGTSSKPHSHPNEQFIYVVQGRIRNTIGGKTRVSGPGGIIHIPANTVHHASVVGKEDYVFITAKDTSWGIQGIPAKETPAARQAPARPGAKAARKKRTPSRPPR
ncbi:MAG: cupin domain-containing protein [Candidatus Tectomicrobia bacterium]|uniref:Cupin domain-containing protein n=1 Tax=Tectimicrobiota bacterium TaxID=2528274 RepID=A0A932ZUS5_UNCTE|nr:cupin domain-containing protein [Candidatus Tectomicrobia bacterium]